MRRKKTKRKKKKTKQKKPVGKVCPRRPQGLCSGWEPGGQRGVLPKSFISISVKRSQSENNVVETKTRTDFTIRLEAGGWRGGGGGACPNRGKGGPSQKRTQSPARESKVSYAI